MDMLSPDPKLKLYNRSWIIHTRTEEHPPARIPADAHVYASMICNGCYIGANSRVESSVISPGVAIRPGAVVRESIILTDTMHRLGGCGREYQAGTSWQELHHSPGLCD
jgi:glucose-1-phosphate adenylyltransferase